MFVLIFIIFSRFYNFLKQNSGDPLEHSGAPLRPVWKPLSWDIFDAIIDVSFTAFIALMIGEGARFLYEFKFYSYFQQLLIALLPRNWL